MPSSSRTVQITLKVSLPIYENLGDTDPYTNLEPQEVIFLSTDNKNWCQIEGKDGIKGWFRIESFFYIPNLQKDVQEVFDNLSMAD